MELLRAPPDTSSFVPLAEHQSRTPASFYSGPPVLHYHSERCKVVILERDLADAPALNALRGGEAVSSNGNGNGSGTTAAAVVTGTGTVNGSASESDRHRQAREGGEEREGEEEEERMDEGNEEEDKEVVIDGVDVWVTSEKFLLYRPATSAGVAIPYPSISLHAIQRLRLPDSSSPEGTEGAEVQGLYMQIAKPAAEGAAVEEDEEEESITLTIVPPPAPPAPAPAATEEDAEMMTDAEKPEETPTQALFAAVSACSNLHPDPVAPGDEDDDEEYGGIQGSSLFQSGLIAPGSQNGGLPPPVEGSSGWITAENMHEYFDEQGNWIGGGEAPPTLPLGPGAGTVRPREDDGGDGEGGENEETKWRRTD
ncbi:regulator of volume decrease after cellular swelling-domain-containing protein [Thermoascus aurantiacus ATCC 26904]